MPSFQTTFVRFTSNFVIFNDTALRISSIESVEKKYYTMDQRWILRIRMVTGKRYDFDFNESVDNLFDQLTTV